MTQPQVSQPSTTQQSTPGRVSVWSSYRSEILVVGATIVGGLLLLSLAFVFHPYSISSGSSVPTLQVGDTVIASKIPYGVSRYSFWVDAGFRGRFLGHAPQRGDVAMFALPRDPSVIYNKRVIALPGETVQMKDGRLFINGTIVPREPIAKVRAEDFEGRDAAVPTYQETLPGGVSHTIIEAQGDTGFNDNTDPVSVPADSYFMMGDNRDNSLDSRVPPDQGGVGFVPVDNFIARADVVLYNARDPDRVLKPVH